MGHPESWWSGFDYGAVLDFDRVQEGHSGAKLLAYLFDLVFGFGFAEGGELVAAGFVFLN